MTRYGVSRYGSSRYSKSYITRLDTYIPSVDNTCIINLVPIVSSLEVAPILSDSENFNDLNPIVSTLEVVPKIEKIEDLKPIIVEAEED